MPSSLDLLPKISLPVNLYIPLPAAPKDAKLIAPAIISCAPPPCNAAEEAPIVPSPTVLDF